MMRHTDQEILGRIEGLELKILEHQDKIGTCQMSVHNRLEEHTTQLSLIDSRFDAQTRERIEQNNKVMKAIDKLQNWADKHGADELKRDTKFQETLSDLVSKVDEISVKTKDNTGYIQSRRHNEELENRVAEKMLEEHKKESLRLAPAKARKEKIIMTAIGVVTTGLTGGIMGIGYMVLKNYMLMQGGN